MIDRKTLDAELADFLEDHVSEEYPYVVAAARERLAQLEGDALVLEKVNGKWTQEAINQAFALIESLTDPRYVIYSEWQQGGAAIRESDEQ